MISKEKVQELIDERIEGTDIFVVELSISEGNRIKVLLDADNGLSIDKCVSVSRNIEHNLDREVEDFELHVSSSGLDNPLRVVRQYKKNVGRSLKVKTNDDVKVEGLLESADDEKIVVVERRKERVEGRKKKEWVEEKHEFNYDNILEAKVVISFK